MRRVFAGVLCALAPALRAHERPPGDRCVEAPSEELALLQVPRGAAVAGGGLGVHANGEARGGQPAWWCLGHAVTNESQIKGLAPSVGWWTTPQPALEVLERQKAKLTVLEAPGWSFKWARPLLSFSSGSGSDAPRAMFEATRGAGYGKVPDKLQGVFWMRGNGAVEELIVIHNGVWLDAKTYAAPPAPFTWAWPLSRPAHPPMNSILYEKKFPNVAWGNAGSVTLLAQANSFKFGTCPWNEQFCRAHAQEHPDDTMAFAYMQVHTHGNAADTYNLGNLSAYLPGAPSFPGIAGRFTLQAMSNDGSRWKRTCDWGLAQCTFLDFGSYDLVKIIDGNGSLVQPYWEEWLQYIGDIQLLMWSGWKSQAAMEESKKTFESLVK